MPLNPRVDIGTLEPPLPSDLEGRERTLLSHRVDGLLRDLQQLCDLGQCEKVYTDRIEKALQSEETKPDVWFLVIPPDVWKYGRPKSTVAPALRQEALKHFTSVRQAKEHLIAPSLFEERNEAAEAYAYQEHFRNQLKARLLKHKVATQVVREPTLQNILKPSDEGFKPTTAIVQPAIAWHLSTAAFYKSGGRPWKVAGVRDGVCYVGLVFKQEDRGGDPRNACCAAQMFLASGDGVVFKGAVGPMVFT